MESINTGHKCNVCDTELCAQILTSGMLQAYCTCCEVSSRETATLSEAIRDVRLAVYEKDIQRYL